MTPEEEPNPPAQTGATQNGHERIVVMDGLRGLAICLVLLYHIWQISWIDLPARLHIPIDLTFIPAMGFYGVDLFFFISAFCLTLPYARHWFADAPPPTLRHYATRRIAKIVPSYWLAIFLMVLFFPDPGITKERLLFHIGTHLLFVHSFFFETFGSIAGVLWSLSVEVQFYLLLPLLLPVLRRAPLVLLFALVGESVLWRVLCLRSYEIDKDVMMLVCRDSQLLSRLDEFGAGMLAAYLLVLLQRSPRTERWAPLFTLFAVVALGNFFVMLEHCFTATRTAMPITLWYMPNRLLLAGTFFVLGVSLPLSVRFFQKIIANRVLVFLSAISYNLYIWHQVLARWLSDHHLPPAATTDPHDDPRWTVLFTIAAWSVSILVATLLTWLWEKPFLTGIPPWRTAAGRQTTPPSQQ